MSAEVFCIFDIWRTLNECVRQNLSLDGFLSLVHFFNEEGIPYADDLNVFSGWTRDTLVGLYARFIGIPAKDGQCAEDELNGIGHLVRIDGTDEWLFTKSSI